MNKPAKPAKVVTVANKEIVKRGFLKQFVDYVEKKGKVSQAELCKRFVSKTAPSKKGEVKVTKTRVVRYTNYCLALGIFELAQ